MTAKRFTLSLVIGLVTLIVSTAGLLAFRESRISVLADSVDRICRSGTLGECRRLISVLHQRNHTALVNKAQTLACGRGDAGICRTQAQIYVSRNQRRHALDSLENACKSGTEPDCRELAKTASLVADSARTFRAYHKLCYSHNQRDACGRLAYLHWGAKNKKATLQAAAYPCKGKREKKSCVAMVPFAVAKRDTNETRLARKLHLVEQVLTDYFYTLESVRRNGSFGNLDRETAIRTYGTVVAPALQRAKLEFHKARVSRLPIGQTRRQQRQVALGYARILSLASKALHQDMLYIESGYKRHFNIAQNLLQAAQEERERIHLRLRQSTASAIARSF